MGGHTTDYKKKRKKKESSLLQYIYTSISNLSSWIRKIKVSGIPLDFYSKGQLSGLGPIFMASSSSRLSYLKYKWRLKLDIIVEPYKPCFFFLSCDGLSIWLHIEPSRDEKTFRNNKSQNE